MGVCILFYSNLRGKEELEINKERIELLMYKIIYKWVSLNDINWKRIKDVNIK